MFLSRRRGVGSGGGVERLALSTVTVPSLLKKGRQSRLYGHCW